MWVRALPKLPDIDDVEIAHNAVTSILERVPSTSGPVWAELAVLHLIRERLEGLRAAIERGDRERAGKLVQALEAIAEVT